MKIDRHFCKCFAIIWIAIAGYLCLLKGLAWCIESHHQAYIAVTFSALAICGTVYLANECAKSKRRKP
jgi:hypothetical protein